MSNPWLSIPLEDYEGHMGSAGVRQLTVLAELFKSALDRCRPESVALLGVAGGNGLEQIDCAATKSIVGVDINSSDTATSAATCGARWSAPEAFPSINRLLLRNPE